MTARDRNVLAVVAVLAMIVGAWFVVIQPKRNLANQLQGQITASQGQLSAAQAQVAAGEAAKRNYSTYYTALARLGEAVPADDNVPSLIIQLQNAAQGTGVDFRDFVLTPGVGSSAAPPTGATGAAGTATALPPGASVGAAGLPIEPFTLNFQGNYFHLASFLGRIQQFVTASNSKISVRGRLLTLNAISLGPAPSGFPRITVSISATAYLSSALPGVIGAGGATPSIGSTPSATSPSSSTSGGSSSGGASSSPGSSFPTAAVTPSVK
ncbi:MAG: type IV pilus inner membrane component PilO [Solirubrobacteraceae bacterium]